MRITYQHTEVNRIKLANLTNFHQRAANHMISSTQAKIKGDVPPGNAPLTVAIKRNSKTLRDSGELMASIAGSFNSDGAAVGTNKSYARINQFGGTIRAKKTWLFIPAGSQTRTLQRRYDFKVGPLIRKMRSSGYSVWFQVKGSKGVVLAREGKKKPFVLFILKKEVKIPARPFLTITQRDRDIIRDIARTEIGVNR